MVRFTEPPSPACEGAVPLRGRAGTASARSSGRLELGRRVRGRRVRGRRVRGCRAAVAGSGRVPSSDGAGRGSRVSGLCPFSSAGTPGCEAARGRLPRPGRAATGPARRSAGRRRSPQRAAGPGLPAPRSRPPRSRFDPGILPARSRRRFAAAASMASTARRAAARSFAVVCHGAAGSTCCSTAAASSSSRQHVRRRAPRPGADRSARRPAPPRWQAAGPGPRPGRSAGTRPAGQGEQRRRSHRRGARRRAGRLAAAAAGELGGGGQLTGRSPGGQPPPAAQQPGEPLIVEAAQPAIGRLCGTVGQRRAGISTSPTCPAATCSPRARSCRARCRAGRTGRAAGRSR